MSSSHGQQGRRGLGYSESRKKEKYEVQSPIREPGLNKIFFVLEASGEFQSRGKTYPSLEIFMTDFDEQLIKSPKPSFEQLVEGTQFMEQKAKARILQSILAAEDVEESERKVMKMTEHGEAKEKAAPEAKEALDADEVIQAIKDSCDE
ncbi:hypothetical protein JCGZ_18135 [Jatropha curcas]|uniref:Uncharacterized protein n=1 Tax=Jatropha curcas TaxID=180498 RepID=A0A067K2P0_JATCU|nr:hypothetical protein JCGZ_18135 [Jatropha curcas]